MILACGALWLASLTHASPRTVMTQAIIAFLPGEGLKIAAAAALAGAWSRRLERRSRILPGS